MHIYKEPVAEYQKGVIAIPLIFLSGRSNPTFQFKIVYQIACLPARPARTALAGGQRSGCSGQASLRNCVIISNSP
ncbi:MAG: hypothetical protein KJ963_01640 [Bacteroidetes bacterium]|nr:hypothetical protein [Bacteroidota bacterium]MBU2635779.1 hypothetical protein [Bacteroidota bacterium]